MMQVLYLHGFASSPGSNKANFFREPLEARGVGYAVPDLNVPSFEKLTLTAMLSHVAETVAACPDGPVVLIGSSLGGLTAVHFMDRYRGREAERVKKVVLLAPAFDFAENRARQLGEDWLEKWRAAGAMPVYHYAYGEERRVHAGLGEDILTYDSYSVQWAVPTLIYHGRHDESVDYQQSVRFAEGRPHVTLHLLASDHQLLDQTDTILKGILEFIGV